jgi:ribosomal protein L40E
MLAAQSHDVDGLAEQKRRILRALKDLESEKAVGRLDDADYETMAKRYRDEAKAVMKRMDERVAPAMAQAEDLARKYLKQHATPHAPAIAAAVVAPSAPPRAAEVAQAASERRACVSCGASNESDAAFCKQCGAALNATKGEDATA